MTLTPKNIDFCRTKRAKYIASFLVICILNQTLFPAAAYALTGGNKAVDFSGFTQLSNGGIVNEHSGDLDYTIELLPELGIPVKLSYNSNQSPQKQVGWTADWNLVVGGTLSRNARNIPDDVIGELEVWNKQMDNHTISVGKNSGMEIFSLGDNGKDRTEVNIGLSLSTTLQHNSTTGFRLIKGAGASFLRGLGSINYTNNSGKSSWSVSVNPAAILNRSINSRKEEKKRREKLKNAVDAKRAGILDDKEMRKSIDEQVKRTGTQNFVRTALTQPISFSTGSYSQYKTSLFSKYSGYSLNGRTSFGAELPLVPIDFNVSGGLNGSYTKQTTEEMVKDSVFGYMYSHRATNTSSVMDYYVDNDAPFNKRNKFMGVPIGAADLFSINAEGVGGSFRLFNKDAGVWRPKKDESYVWQGGVSAEGSVGFTVPIEVVGGPGASGGFSRLSTEAWDMGDHNSAFKDQTNDENTYFRFNNDLGGAIEYNNVDGPERAQVKRYNGVKGSLKFKAYKNNISTTSNGGNRAGRSNYVAYHTNKEMLDLSNGVRYRSFSKDPHVESLVKRNDTKLHDQIGEIAVWDKNGRCFKYALPVYTCEEKNLSYDLQGVKIGNIKNQHIAYKDVQNTAGMKIVSGTIRRDAYANDFLLTEINGPDYVDVTQNGVTFEDDLGSAAILRYKRVHGSFNKADSLDQWYRFGAPYNGLFYQKGSLSTIKDDLGTRSSGLKEVYYLDSVITRTHIAKFYTSDMHSGLDAKSFYEAAKDSTAKGTKQLKKLDKIELYVKKDDGTTKLVKTVYFKYRDPGSVEELCKGVPNATNSTYGKLTLWKVWTEYNGVRKTRTAPYTFLHKYMKKSEFPTSIQTRYPNIVNHADSLTDEEQNPNFSEFITDGWGAYHPNGEERFAKMQTWNDQTLKPNDDYDPAAWVLKQIHHPGGGITMIQYDAKTYNHVQDKVTHAMVSLKEYTGTDEHTKFYLHAEDIGIDSTDVAAKQALTDRINSMYAGKSRMYFKFLYRLVGYGDDPQITDYNADYLSGFIPIDTCLHDSKGVYIRLKDDANEGDDNYTIPREVCKEYVKTQKMGNVNVHGKVDDNTVIDYEASWKEIFRQFAQFATNWTKSLSGNYFCKKINPRLSYFRVPMIHKEKLAGGARVKRVLMLDEGLETGDEALIGTEYDYTTSSVYGQISSGVAVNEPVALKDESILYTYYERDEHGLSKWQRKVVFGDEMDQSTGPIAGSLIGAASIGYGKVTAKNIHNGKTSTGVVVKEYNTAKDYPMQVEFTGIQHKKDWMKFPLIYFNGKINNIFASQGFTVKVQNSFFGTPKSESTWSAIPGTPGATRSAKVTYEYYQPNEEIPLLTENEQIVKGKPGKEVDLNIESRSVVDHNVSTSTEFDGDLAIYPPYFALFTASGSGNVAFSESKLKSNVVAKIINYPAIVKKTVTTSNGIAHTNEVLALDAYSGDPVLTRSYDGYHKQKMEKSSDHKGYYHEFKYLGSHHYKDLGPKAFNHGKKLASTSDLKLELVYLATGGAGGSSEFRITKQGAESQPYSDISKYLVRGDVVEVKKGANTNAYFVLDNQDNVIKLEHGPMTDLNLVSSMAGECDVEVTKSGRANSLTTSVGSVTTYGDSLNINSANYYANNGWYANDTSYKYTPAKAVAASAIVLHNQWQYEDSELWADYGFNPGPSVPLRGIVSWGRHQYRLSDTYVYKDSIIGANGTDGRNYANAGVMKSFVPFNWADTSQLNDNWKKTSTITKYTPHGEAIEEQDILGIYSSVRMGCYQQLPVMVAQNAPYHSIRFDGFEQGYDSPYNSSETVFENLLFEQDFSAKWVTDTAHSGNKSLRIKKGGGFCFMAASYDTYTGNDFKITQQMKDKGLMIRFWLKRDNTPLDSLSIDFHKDGGGASVKPKLTSIARTGEWELIDARTKLSDATFVVGDPLNITLELTSNAQNQVYIDDFVIKPVNASSISYVYDPKTFRLIASFDDQHFGLYYIYDAEGKLTMKLIETEEGIKTIQQNAYNVPGQNR